MTCLRALLLLSGLWLLTLGAQAQSIPPADTTVVVVPQVPAEGFAFTEGWKFHAGDNLIWARADFDDRQWDTLDMVRPVRQLPKRLPAGVSWFRLRFRLADSLRAQPLLLQVKTMGATEIYLNGQLVQQVGSLHSAIGNPGWFSPEPILLSDSSATTQVLAVRFAPWVPPLQVIPRSSLLVAFLVHETDFYRQQVVLASKAKGFLIALGIFLLLTLLHGAFLIFNSKQQANFYFALYALTLALSILSNGGLGNPPLSARIFLHAIAQLLLMLSNLWMVRALCGLFGVQPGWMYRLLWIGFGLMVVLAATHLDTGAFMGYFYPAFVAAAFIEQLRLTVQARRQRGAYIVGAGFAGALLALVIIVSLLFQWPAAFSTVSHLVFMFLYLPPALGISLFLAREFALDARLLQVKLQEVEQLSAQTLAQEQEKQALLASQNETLEHQVAQRTSELQRSLTNLRATQNQLIQKEKMASLGELTAGIAHEIQNPLNFVNNFSDVSAELVGELREEKAKGAAADQGLEAELLDDLEQNLTKISQHGQRAAGIVRGMLEHSRQSTGERQPTDVNALCDEYLRLAYHGLRAKDKSFNATLETDFTPDLPRVSGVGADLGRVLLNLLNNAFYAVQQRQQVGEADYRPTVSVSTRQVGRQVEIRVADNGTGIPESVKAKIFQPFFTTKPTGEGTGLGLSLSYDIITKGHGGTLAVASEVGKGTEFIVTLPQ